MCKILWGYIGGAILYALLMTLLPAYIVNILHPLIHLPEWLTSILITLGWVGPGVLLCMVPFFRRTWARPWVYGFGLCLWALWLGLGFSAPDTDAIWPIGWLMFGLTALFAIHVRLSFVINVAVNTAQLANYKAESYTTRLEYLEATEELAHLRGKLPTMASILKQDLDLKIQELHGLRQRSRLPRARPALVEEACSFFELPSYAGKAEVDTAYNALKAKYDPERLKAQNAPKQVLALAQKKLAQAEYFHKVLTC